ncbi:MAG: hypothetical protein HRT89_20875 [Lentisphaeria bacterium]|nr:hypothetical protein [Lentisphaeria bacterium]NQZ70514.1 hypothetical protein [Lentisphaeria bacterium]
MTVIKFTDSLDYSAQRALVKRILETDMKWEFEAKRLKIRVFSEAKTGLDIWLSQALPVPGNMPDKDYLLSLPELQPNHFILLMESGAAALAQIKNNEIIRHKVIKAYMNRKKQGKSQLNYLKTKGKSRAGSRLRIRKSIEFFEEINQKIIDWGGPEDAERICYKASIQLWPYLFKSDIAASFEKDDPRLIKIPLNTKSPSYNELIRVHKYIQYCHIDVYDEDLYKRIK